MIIGIKVEEIHQRVTLKRSDIGREVGDERITWSRDRKTKGVPLSISVKTGPERKRT